MPTWATPDGTAVVAQIDGQHWAHAQSSEVGEAELRKVAASVAIG